MNLNRLVRSASNDEDYCSYIIKEIDTRQWTLEQIFKLWEEAKQSDLTVSQFIEQHKRNEHEL